MYIRTYKFQSHASKEPVRMHWSIHIRMETYATFPLVAVYSATNWGSNVGSGTLLDTHLCARHMPYTPPSKIVSAKNKHRFREVVCIPNTAGPITWAFPALSSLSSTQHCCVKPFRLDLGRILLSSIVEKSISRSNRSSVESYPPPTTRSSPPDGALSVSPLGGLVFPFPIRALAKGASASEKQRCKIFGRICLVLCRPWKVVGQNASNGRRRWSLYSSRPQRDY